MNGLCGEAKRKTRADGAATSKEEKRRKFQAKQERKLQQASNQQRRESWFQEHSSFATLVKEQDVIKVRQFYEHGSEFRSKEEITQETRALAALLAPYLDIQDTKEGSRSKSKLDTGRLFIAEGTETIRVLLQQCAERNSRLDAIKIKSIFVKPSVLFDPPVQLLSDVVRTAPTAETKSEADEFGKTPMSPPFQVLVGESEFVLGKVAGFPISRGALACGNVPDGRNEAWLDDYLRTRLQVNGDGRNPTCRMLALDGICDTANLGSMIRTASALGVDVIVLSHDTCDPWYRRSIRVSMGHVFLIPIVRVKSLAAFLTKWKTVTSFAAVVQEEDSIALHGIPPQSVPRRWCCVVGNEGSGISKKVLEKCSRKIRIEMVEGVDSLSVPIATGILLHGLRERE